MTYFEKRRNKRIHDCVKIRDIGIKLASGSTHHVLAENRHWDRFELKEWLDSHMDVSIDELDAWASRIPKLLEPMGDEDRWDLAFLFRQYARAARAVRSDGADFEFEARMLGRRGRFVDSVFFDRLDRFINDQIAGRKYEITRDDWQKEHGIDPDDDSDLY